MTSEQKRHAILTIAGLWILWFGFTSHGFRKSAIVHGGVVSTAYVVGHLLMMRWTKKAALSVEPWPLLLALGVAVASLFIHLEYKLWAPGLPVVQYWLTDCLLAFAATYVLLLMGLAISHRLDSRAP